MTDTFSQLYVSLDTAREELKKRWENQDLRSLIEKELGERFMPMFGEGPRGMSFRQVCSPDNGFTFFYQCAQYVGAKPIILEYHDDIFVSFNEEKKGLGRLRLISDDGKCLTADVMNFHENEKMKLGLARVKDGSLLIDFHRNLFVRSGYDIEIYENSQWLHSFGKASDYYYPFLLHSVAHGVLFETFLAEEGSDESEFTEAIIVPAIEKIRKLTGFQPLIVRPYPDNQDEKEDFYWWCYPPHINKYLLEYVQARGIVPKSVSI